MPVDENTVRRVAHLARIRLTDDEAGRMTGQLNGILGFVEQLSQVDTHGVAPMDCVMPMHMRGRADTVTDGGDAEDIMANAPARDGDFFLVPKVIE